MAISNLKKDLYDDENNTMEEEVSSAAFSDYVPESPIKKPEEIKESLLDTIKDVASDVSKTLGVEGDVDVKDILKGILKGSTEDEASSGESTSDDEDETLEKLAKIIADGDLEEKVNFCRENFSKKISSLVTENIEKIIEGGGTKKYLAKMFGVKESEVNEKDN